MIRNQTLRPQVSRNNLFGFIFRLAYQYSVIPCIFLETFLRSSQGRKHFSFSRGLLLFVALLVFPIFMGRFFTRTQEDLWNRHYNAYTHRYSLEGNVDLLKGYEAWYVVALLFFILLIERAVEVLRHGWKHDAVRRLDHHGDYLPIFWLLKVNGKPISVRAVETIWEPLVCFIPGLILHLNGQYIGIFIMICAAWYSLAYTGAFHVGDRFTDETLIKEHSAKEKRDALKKHSTFEPSPNAPRGYETRAEADSAWRVPPPPSPMGPPPKSSDTTWAE